MPTPVKWGEHTVALFRVLTPYFRPPWGAPLEEIIRSHP